MQCQNYLEYRLHPKPLLRLNMIPMVDCILILLTFFMITTTFSPVHGLHVDLAPACLLPCPTALWVLVDAPSAGKLHGIMRFQKTVRLRPDLTSQRIVTFDQLGSELEHAPLDMKNRIFIRAHRDTPHGQIVRIVDAVKQSGVKQVLFIVTARE